MNSLSVEEGNKLIALFIGAEIIKPVGHLKRTVKLNAPIEYLQLYNEKDLKYHKSWDWFMPVVEKISKIKYEEWEQDNGIDEKYIEYDTAYPRTFGMINSKTGNPMVRINRHSLFEAPTLIEATWQAVVSFIQWYNEQKQSPIK